MAKFTMAEMLEALNRLPEDEKTWSDVRRALVPNASERTIERAFNKRCPEAKDPDLAAWQKYESTSKVIDGLRKSLEHYWSDSELGLVGSVASASPEDVAAFEEHKNCVESEIKELLKILDETRDGWAKWRKLTGVTSR